MQVASIIALTFSTLCIMKVNKNCFPIKSILHIFNIIFFSFPLSNLRIMPSQIKLNKLAVSIAQKYPEINVFNLSDDKLLILIYRYNKCIP